MPIREFACVNEACERHLLVEEMFFHPSQDPVKGGPTPVCRCGQPMKLLASRFAVTFCGEISARYLDKKYGSETAPTGAHWAYRKNTPSGVPEPVYVDSWQKQREFCKSEGLLNPSDINPGARISRDGKKLETAGMPGAWV